MRRSVKRESEATRNGSGRRDSGESEPFKSVKKEKGKEKKKKNKNVAGFPRPNEPPLSQEEEEEEGISDPRLLTSQYLALMNKISDSKEDLTRVDSEKFSCFFSEFENLNQQGWDLYGYSIEVKENSMVLYLIQASACPPQIISIL